MDHIRTIIGNPTNLYPEEPYSLFSFLRDAICFVEHPKTKIADTLTESLTLDRRVIIGSQEPAKHLCRFLEEELYSLKNDHVIGQINIDAAIYPYMYFGNSLPTNPEGHLHLYSYARNSKTYKGATMRAIGEYTRDVFLAGFQDTRGLYSVYANRHALERHVLYIESTDGTSNAEFLNSFHMDFLYHNPDFKEVIHLLPYGSAGTAPGKEQS